MGEGRKDIAFIKFGIGIIISVLFSFASLVSCNTIRESLTKNKVQEKQDELEFEIPEIELTIGKKILSLKESGKSFGEIAKLLEIDKNKVYYLYKKEIK